ncbi:MAG: DEAD/DEAH box helicase [Marinilabiliaceae bacterium]|nr:DEAD/DEAH box helicase [Marinilabiliaceae bacterium]
MNSFNELNLPKQLFRAIEDLGFIKPTPIQAKTYSIILSGRDIVGIAQTGTGKTLAFMLPLLQNIKFSKDGNPRIVVIAPTRELVIQLVDQIKNYTKYTSLRVCGVYGGVKMGTHIELVQNGVDILVATPARIYDLTISKALILKHVNKLVIDEVDIMLDLGYLFQLKNIFDLLPTRRQNIMFSATMTEEIDALLDNFFTAPERVSIAVSGTRLENINQQCYEVKNFNTKINLLKHLLNDKENYKKVLVFVSNKTRADLLFESLQIGFVNDVCLIHSGKTQNFRINSLQQFSNNECRIMVSTDIMARGIDVDDISHVINFDTPHYPENYIHRIGRTGRAKKLGNSLLFYTQAEKEYKDNIEKLMNYIIPTVEFPNNVTISSELIAEEKPKPIEFDKPVVFEKELVGSAFHEKKEHNKKTNMGGSYRKKIKEKYKKPKTKGDKNFNKRRKKQ